MRKCNFSLKDETEGLIKVSTDLEASLTAERIRTEQTEVSSTQKAEETSAINSEGCVRKFIWLNFGQKMICCGNP